MTTATARAHPNIAFIKYWGNASDALRLPVNPSISMNLDGLYAETTVTWDEALPADTLRLNGKDEAGPALERVQRHLHAVRQHLRLTQYARVVSHNNFPTGTGIASSAAAFAALTVAAAGASGQAVPERALSTLARLGSGSAARSVPAGFVRWFTGDSHETSYAESFAAPDHWALVDVIAIVSDQHKATGSQEGHPTAPTSDLQAARVAGAAARFELCQQAILARDFDTFAEVVERDSNLMHAVMMTSRPPLFYWLPATLALMAAVRRWRAEGLRVCYTLDAGPNVHCICIREDADQVRERLWQHSGILEVRRATVGGGAALVNAG
ncbi:MAG: diphosphomevalonate decarboxylase [Anaerolineae bacterium]|nr:diphosphomevalonate decarboxylase [Anaerolineae bacterium]